MTSGRCEVVRLPEVRQPRQHDLIGGTFSIAGFDTGFEATVSWRVLEQDADVLAQGRDGDVLAEGRVEGVGSMRVVDDLGHEVSLPPSVSARGAHASGQNPPGERYQPGPHHALHGAARLAALRGRLRRQPDEDRARPRAGHPGRRRLRGQPGHRDRPRSDLPGTGTEGRCSDRSYGLPDRRGREARRRQQGGRDVGTAARRRGVEGGPS